MTVREAVSMLTDAKEIYLLWGGANHAFDADDDIYLAAFGDFKVKRIQPAYGAREYQLELALLPMKC